MLYFWFLMRLGGNCCMEGFPTQMFLDWASLFLQQSQEDQEQHLQGDSSHHSLHLSQSDRRLGVSTSLDFSSIASSPACEEKLVREMDC